MIEYKLRIQFIFKGYSRQELFQGIFYCILKMYKEFKEGIVGKKQLFLGYPSSFFLLQSFPCIVYNCRLLNWESKPVVDLCSSLIVIPWLSTQIWKLLILQSSVNCFSWCQNKAYESLSSLTRQRFLSASQKAEKREGRRICFLTSYLSLENSVL